MTIVSTRLGRFRTAEPVRLPAACSIDTDSNLMPLKPTAFGNLRFAVATLATAIATGICPGPALAVVYTNVTATAGITYLQHPGSNTEVGLFRTGGAAAGDFDNDGWVDIFATRLNARPLLYRN